MNYLLKMITVSFLATVFYTPNIDIYSFKVQNINQKDSIDLNDYRGKYILIVNTATSSIYSPQIAALDSLHRLRKDSLVIIAFPSNSFGNESEKNKDIKKLMKARFNYHFLMAEKTKVKGENISPLYDWLTSKHQNGVMNAKVRNDFYKYLIDKQGHLIGVFNETVSPMGPEISSAFGNTPIN